MSKLWRAAVSLTICGITVKWPNLKSISTLMKEYFGRHCTNLPERRLGIYSAIVVVERRWGTKWRWRTFKRAICLSVIFVAAARGNIGLSFRSLPCFTQLLFQMSNLLDENCIVVPYFRKNAILIHDLDMRNTNNAQLVESAKHITILFKSDQIPTCWMQLAYCCWQSIKSVCSKSIVSFLQVI